MSEEEETSQGPEPYAQDTDTSEEELLQAGWERRFVADEPRLTESVELYESLRFEVALRPLGDADLTAEDCTECFKADPARFRVIYTRKRRN
ncbi:MAG: hypothetical protein ACYS47_06585 [Planctomycetota bacterium]|jgi:hypothetical protein